MNAPFPPRPKKRLRIATATLGGCFGCHMSLLDMDERVLELAKIADFDRSPLTDIKNIGSCDLGLIEGGVCNAENVHTLREFRAHCRMLVAVGACAINGGLPAQRNPFDLGDLMRKVYCDRSEDTAQIPNDPELPLMLDKVYPIHEIVRIDYLIPGCPPSADALWKFLTDLIDGRTPRLDYQNFRFD